MGGMAREGFVHPKAVPPGNRTPHAARLRSRRCDLSRSPVGRKAYGLRRPEPSLCVGRWRDGSPGAGWLAAAPSTGKAVPRGTALHTLREFRHKAQEGAPAYGLRRPEPALSVGHGGGAPVQVVGFQRLGPPAKQSLGAPHSTRSANSGTRSRESSPGLAPSRPERPPKLFTKPWRKRPRDSASLRWNVIGRRQCASGVPPALL